MLTIRPFPALVALLLSFLLHGAAECAPQGAADGGMANGMTSGEEMTAQEQAAQVPQGLSQAADGSVILDTTVTVNNLPLRFKVSAPATSFTALSSVPGAASPPNTLGPLGLNVLLHGDGGQSFFDFPNQGVNAGLAGVAVLAPDPNLFWGGGAGLERTEGVPHAAAVNDLVLGVLPQLLSFDPSNVFFTGVSGGSLLLSGFFLPAHGTTAAGNGVLLNCGALAPQVPVADPTAAALTRVHFQSTLRELELLQGAIPEALLAYEELAASAGLGAAGVNALLTVDNSPDGGHCEFDGQDFVAGVQLMADNFANVIAGDGEVEGIGNVLNGVVGNEALVFEAGE